MKLSELYTKIQADKDALSYATLLATPDSDGVDVDLSPIGRVEIDSSAGVVRLYPTVGDQEPDATQPAPWLASFLDELPMDVSAANDYRLMVELPLVRNESGHDQLSLVEICGLHVGHESQEVWLLARPAADFASGLLPA